MKKIFSISIAVLAITILVVSCKKTDEAGGTTPPAPHANATLEKIVQPDSFRANGKNGPVATYKLIIRDSAMKMIRADITTASSIFDASTVRVEIGNNIISEEFSVANTSGKRTFNILPFKYTVPVGEYIVNIFSTAQITGDIDSTIFSLKLGAPDFNNQQPVEGQKIYFVNGSVYMQKSITTPQSKNITPTSVANEMLRTDALALGSDQKPSYIKVTVNNPLVNLVQIKLNGVKIGSIAPTNGNAYMSLNGGIIAKGTTGVISVWCQFSDLTGSQSTGVATTAIIRYIEFKDNSGTLSKVQDIYVGEPMYVYKTVFSITGSNSIQQIVLNTKMSLHKSTFSADGAVKQIGYKFTWVKAVSTDTLTTVLSFEENGMDITNSVYFTKQNGDTITSLTANESMTKVFVTFKAGNGESVISGTKDYELKGICKGFLNDQSALQVEIEEDKAYVQPTTLSYYPGKPFQVTLNGTTTSIVISDMSMTGTNGFVGLAKPDFFGGYLVLNTSGTGIVRK